MLVDRFAPSPGTFVKLRRARKGPRRPARIVRLGRAPMLEELEGRSLPSTIIVNSTADTNPNIRSSIGTMTLREALLLAQNDPSLPYKSLTPSEQKQLSGPPDSNGRNTIIFEIGSGARSILVNSKGLGPLPPIQRPVVIDATPPLMANGAVIPRFASQVVNVTGIKTVAGYGFQIIGGSAVAGGGSVIRGLVINGFFAGIGIQGNPDNAKLGNNTVEGDFIGVGRFGGVSPGIIPNGTGVLISDSPGNTIGAATNLPPALAAGRGNVISLNGNSGVLITGVGSERNTVVGNFIGTTGAGTAAAGNGMAGVTITNAASKNTVTNNTISDNGTASPAGAGVRIDSAENNVINANFIGTNRFGTGHLGNRGPGVEVSDTLNLNVPFGNSVTNNVISDNTGDGVAFLTSTGNSLSGNLIGTDRIGTDPLGNRGNGVRVLESSEFISNNLIAESGGDGIRLEGASNNNVIVGNVIGTDKTGKEGRGNAGAGVSINGGSSNFIGGTNPGQGNLIADNGGNGVTITGADPDNPVTRNQVLGDFIGTNVAGTSALGNSGYGVQIKGSAVDNFIGFSIRTGLTQLKEGANLISGNALSGIQIAGADARGNVVDHDYIGTEANGTIPLGNGQSRTADGDGVEIIDSPGNFVTNSVISGNPKNGVLLSGTKTTGTTLSGDLIGTNWTGTGKVGNGMSGVRVDAPGNLIGNPRTSVPNVISGNTGSGVTIGPAATGNKVQFSEIGTDINGTAKLGNGGNGVIIINAGGNLIGGTDFPAGDLISANGGAGVAITGPGAVQNQVVDDRIGTNRDGSMVATDALPNGSDGVSIGGRASANRVIGNRIGFNAGAGVRDQNGPGFSDLFSQNSIFANQRLGIDIGLPGPTLTGVPVLTSVIAGPRTVTIRGTLMVTANANYTVEFFENVLPDPSTYGQGEVYIGSAVVTPVGMGLAFIQATLPVRLFATQFVSATATDPQSHTSEFSKNVPVTLRANRAPVAVKDTYAVVKGTPLNVAAPGVLANDSDPDGDPITAVLVTGPGHGLLTLNDDGSFTYKPNRGFTGVDTFTYQASDGRLLSNIATVTLNVAGIPTITTVSSSANPSFVGQPVTFSARVAAARPASGTPKGSIQFQVDGADFGAPVPLNSSGTAQSGSLATLAAGRHNVVAVYTGDDRFDRSTGSLPQTVNKIGTTTRISSSANPSTVGQSVTFSANVAAVAPGGGVPAGTVQFQVDGVNLGAPVSLTGGTATSLATTTLSPGAHNVTALYSGNAVYLASAATLAQKVNRVVIAPLLLVVENGTPDVVGIDPAGNKSVFTAVNLGSPIGIGLDRAGNVYVVNQGITSTAPFHDSVSKYSSSGRFLGSFVSPTTAPGNTLNAPIDIAFDDGGNAYVTSGALPSPPFGYVARYNMAGTFQVSFGTVSTNVPSGIGFNPVNKRLYVANAGNDSFAIFDPADLAAAPTVITPAGPGALDSPQQIAFDARGNVYIASFGSGTGVTTVQEYSPTGAFLKTFASSATDPNLRAPGGGAGGGAEGVAIDSAGNLYVSLLLTGTVVKFDPSGIDQGVLATGLNGAAYLAVLARTPSSPPPPS